MLSVNRCIDFLTPFFRNLFIIGLFYAKTDLSIADVQSSMKDLDVINLVENHKMFHCTHSAFFMS
jgi:hypothetical protein